ncbi:MAG TPA: hypothetical protein VEY06_08295, partial [Flavisolibacter sp.]|nr:hypothetical protein [Flavisolibacter sp.]
MRRFANRFAIICFSVFVIISCSKKDTQPDPPPPPLPTVPVIQAPPPFGFYVVGYFPNYRAIADVPDVKFKMCNVVNYAFFSVNTAGTLTVNNPTLVPQVVTKAKTNVAKVMVSINEA